MIKINNEVIKDMQYPNGEFGITNFNENIRNSKVNIKRIVEKGWEKEFIYLIEIVFKYHSFDIELYIDYMPLQREDKTEFGRLSNFGLYPIFVKENINLKFDTMHNVFAYNAYQISDKFKKFVYKIIFENNKYYEEINDKGINDKKIINEKKLIVFPDESAYLKYKDLFNFERQHLNYVVLKKARDKITGKIIGQEIKENNSKVALSEIEKVYIVDDICSYGGTFIGALETLKTNGLSRNLFWNNINLITYADEEQVKDEKFYDWINHHYIKKINFK